MTKPSKILMTAIALLVLCAAAPALLLAKGPPIKVTESIPATGEQGTTIKPVKLRGSNFEPGTPQIRFYLSSTGTQVSEAKLKAVGVNWISAEEIQYDLVIGPEADPVEYDIEVYYSSTRKGKGTTLFKVQSKPNQEETVSCMEVFFPEEELSETNIKCDCEFPKPGENWPHYGMLRDCYTSATLELQTYGLVNPSSSTPDGTEMATLTAVLGKDGSPFLGSSVISNTTDRIGVRFLNIRFAPGVARGCDQELQSAISFVLDEETDNPATNSGLNVADVTIDTEGNAPLCTAIEVLRLTDVEIDGNLEGPQGYVANVTIAEGSYEKFGINYEGMQPAGSLTKQLFGNYIGAPDCDHEPETAAIQIGGVILTDPFDQSSQNPVVAESNIIRMENSGCPGPVGVGIRVVGEPEDSGRIPFGGEWRQSTAEVVKNVISGAMVGVEVDDNVLNVHFSGNTLVGDPNDDYDIGICTEAWNTSTKGKPNVWSGYDADDEIHYASCLLSW